MEVRKDLTEVEPLIHRLLSIGHTFSKNIESWLHLNDKEDFRCIERIPHNERPLVEALYADGREMAQFMAWTIIDINDSYADFPTLTSIVKKFEGTYVYGAYDENVPDVAKGICDKYGENLWSVNKMIELFRNQEHSLLAVKVTLQMLKESDLYKKENGIEIVKEVSSTINVSGVTSSAINIQSSSSSAQVTTHTQYHEPAIFGKMLESIKGSDLDEKAIEMLTANINMLATSHEAGNFSDAYKDFMQNVSSHITVFTPFIAGLSALL
ncbi:hypothetical protein MT371_12980 [Vibrio parahaemolyticus]|nr:hypothetical protein [Vibrio parahaemolyticus]